MVLESHCGQNIDHFSANPVMSLSQLSESGISKPSRLWSVNTCPLPASLWWTSGSLPLHHEASKDDFTLEVKLVSEDPLLILWTRYKLPYSLRMQRAGLILNSWPITHLNGTLSERSISRASVILNVEMHDFQASHWDMTIALQLFKESFSKPSNKFPTFQVISITLPSLFTGKEIKAQRNKGSYLRSSR